MLYLTFYKNLNLKNSFICVLINNNGRVIKKLGILSFNKILNLFVFHINLKLLCFLFLKTSILIEDNFYKIFLRVCNSTKVF